MIEQACVALIKILIYISLGVISTLMLVCMCIIMATIYYLVKYLNIKTK